MLPLHLDVRGRRVLVAGGGPVAARRAGDLLAEGADVVVVAPQLCEDLAARAGELTWHAREAVPADVDGAWLVHTATGDPATDTALADAAAAQRTWCVRAGDAAASTAWTPAVVRRSAGSGEVVVSVTAGRDPRRAQALKARLALALDERGTGRPGRRPDRGRVTLVGGGPGGADLLTLAGRRALAEADVVVVDRLAPLDVLDDLDPDVRVVDVGKTVRHHPVPQDAIGELLVAEARAGHRVVRLKGGDPFVLGRGGEEVLACRAAGVDVDVLPGVTSAFAVPAAAGVPVTHRGLARGVLVVSGHDVSSGAADLAALAALDATLVVLMGVATLPVLADGLLAHGRDPATPVAVVEDGWRPGQRTTRARLDEVAATAAAVGVASPAVVVVGAVAGLDLSAG